MWQYLKVVIYSFNSFIMYFTDEELQKWKVEDLQKYLLQQGVPTGNNARKANSIHCANSAKPRRRRKGYFKYKAQIEHWWRSNPNNIKENCITGSEPYQILFWKILMNMQNWIRQRKLQRKGETYYFLATRCQSSLTQSFPAWNIALLKELLSHRHVLMKIPIVCGSAFLKMAQFWQVSAAVWQAWYRHVNMSLQYCIILKARKSLVITRPAQAKSKNGMYVCIGKGKIFTSQLK